MSELRSKDPVSRQEYERRFKARIVERLVGPQWSQAQAEHAADTEWSAISDQLSTEDLDLIPEDQADECLSYWDDDGE